jgi:hypothetical protein
MRVRRYFCDRKSCSRTTFVEQVPGLSAPYRRSSIGLTGWLRSIAIELGGRPAARLCQRPRLTAGRTRLLRLKGCTCRTVLVDVEAGRVLDLLADRTSETFAAWLTEHTGAEISGLKSILQMSDQGDGSHFRRSSGYGSKATTRRSIRRAANEQNGRTTGEAVVHVAVLSVGLTLAAASAVASPLQAATARPAGETITVKPVANLASGASVDAFASGMKPRSRDDYVAQCGHPGERSLWACHQGTRVRANTDDSGAFHNPADGEKAFPRLHGVVQRALPRGL